jgi:hypothetical protein
MLIDSVFEKLKEIFYDFLKNKETAFKTIKNSTKYNSYKMNNNKINN